MTPAKKVAVKARRRYSAGLSSGSISARRRVPSKRETTATGPMAISLELPMNAYISGGTKLLSVYHNQTLINVKPHYLASSFAIWAVEEVAIGSLSG